MFLFCTICTVVLGVGPFLGFIVELFALTVLWCFLFWCLLVLKLHLVLFERRLVILRFACRVGCFAAGLAAFAALLLGFTSMFVCWPFVLAGGARVPGAVDATALFRSVTVPASLGLVRCAASAHILAKVLSNLVHFRLPTRANHQGC